jgi:hypothetical protein
MWSLLTWQRIIYPYLPISPRQIADEARTISGLKGFDKVNW